LEHYVSPAQFKSVPEIIEYLKDTHQLMQKFMIRDHKERNGRCELNGPKGRSIATASRTILNDARARLRSKHH
jgi:hypothetical protein